MFRDVIVAMDAAVFAALGDAGTINGLPVMGMFASPWLQPTLGKLNTPITEPQFTVRDGDAHGVKKGMPVHVDGQGDYSIVGLEPAGDGLTVLVLRLA